MILFHSGDGFNYAQPEILLGDECCLMMTYADQRGKQPDPRFREIHRVRKERLEQQKQQEKENKDGRSV